MYVAIIAIIIIIDRITKILASKYLAQITTLPVINKVLHFTYSENTGAAFSILEGKAVYLAIFSLIVTILLFIFFMHQKKRNSDRKLYLISIAMIIGGAIGNMLDRFAFGYVIDFIDFRLINFAIFNVADSFLTIATIMLCACLLFDKKIQL